MGNRENLDFEEGQYIYDHSRFRVIITFLAVTIRRSECFMKVVSLLLKNHRCSRCLISILTIMALVLSSVVLPVHTLKSSAAESTSSYGLGNPTIGNGVTTWDCIYFGNYWQNDTNGDGKADQNDKKQPIEWWVLSVNGNDAFLLAD